ncbi:hypothetical protein D3C87_1808200 [compost metagenome]
MHRPARDDFRTRGDRTDDGHIAFGEHDRLAGAHRLVDDQRLDHGPNLARSARLFFGQFGGNGDGLDLDI